MKTSKLICTLTVAAIALGITGCKQETKSISDQAQDAASGVTDTAAKTLGTAHDAASKVATDVTEQVKEVAAPVSEKAQELIDSAKNLVGQGKFADALTKLKEIGSEKLSVEQQSVVTGLKTQIEQALGAGSKAATDAAGAAAGLIPTK